MTKPNGRPHGGQNMKLDEAAAEKVCVALRQGATLDAAAAYTGVARSVVFDWLRKGRQAGARQPYKGFVEKVDEAFAMFEVTAIAQIAKAGADGEWQATAWRLERRFPDKYGRRTRVDGNLQVSAAPVIDASKLTVDELETLRRLLAKARPEQEQLTEQQRPALELLPGEAVG